MVPFRAGGASAARAYLAKDTSTVMDDYYLQAGELTATRFVYNARGQLTDVTLLDGQGYEAWADWTDPLTGETRGAPRQPATDLDGGTLRRGSALFFDKIINADKTLSIAALLDDQVNTQLDQAMAAASDQMMSYLASNMHTRIGPRGSQEWVPVEQFEAATVAHRTSREGDPHRHLHVHLLNRVYAAGKWRGLDTQELFKHNETMNRLVEAVIGSHEGLQKALAQAGWVFDPATGSIPELAEVGEVMSKRAGQISTRRTELIAQWMQDHPQQSPGKKILEGLDHLAWAQTRREKTPQTMPNEEVWRAEINATGYRMPTQAVDRGSSRGLEYLDRDELGTVVVDRLAQRSSAWSVAEVHAGVAQYITESGLTADPAQVQSVTHSLAVQIVRTHCTPLDPEISPITAPGHLKMLTSAQVINDERDLRGLLLAKGLEASIYPETKMGPHQDCSQEALKKIFAGIPGRTPDGRPITLPESEGHRAGLRMMSGTHQLVVVTGAAGAGKTTLLTAAKHVAEAQGRRQVIVTPSSKAAEVAAQETGAGTATAHKLLRDYGYRWETDPQTQATTWSRINPQEAGRAGEGPRLVLGPSTQLVVDEAGMLSQEVATRLMSLATETGAQVVLTGDYAQLGAVGRGGVLQMAEAATEASVDLDTVHRFKDPEYAQVSLMMRERTDPAAQFERLQGMGLVHVHSSQDAAEQALATAWSNHHRAGESVVVSAATNPEATRINTLITQHSSHPDQGAVIMGADGLPIREGNRVMTRKNDAELGVLNRQAWIVAHLGAEHTRLKDPENNGRAVTVPNEYLQKHTHAGYAVTTHGAQGVTTGHGHLLVGPGSDAAGVYVGMTRGRESNHVHLVAADLEEARQNYVQAMGRARVDQGLDAAAQDLKVQLMGMKLPSRMDADRIEYRQLLHAYGDAERGHQQGRQTYRELTRDLEHAQGQVKSAGEELEQAKAALQRFGNQQLELAQVAYRPVTVAQQELDQASGVRGLFSRGKLSARLEEAQAKFTRGYGVTEPPRRNPFVAQGPVSVDEWVRTLPGYEPLAQAVQQAETKQSQISAQVDTATLRVKNQGDRVNQLSALKIQALNTLQDSSIAKDREKNRTARENTVPERNLNIQQSPPQAHTTSRSPGLGR